MHQKSPTGINRSGIFMREKVSSWSSADLPTDFSARMRRTVNIHVEFSAAQRLEKARKVLSQWPYQVPLADGPSGQHRAVHRITGREQVNDNRSVHVPARVGGPRAEHGSTMSVTKSSASRRLNMGS